MKKVKLERSINLNQVRSPNGMIKILILNSQSVHEFFSFGIAIVVCMDLLFTVQGCRLR